MSTLEIQVFSGLGSRMRAVLGAIAWAKANDCSVRVCWPWADQSETAGEFPVWFSELFDSPLSEQRMIRQIRNGREWPKYPMQVNDKLWRCRTCDPLTLKIDELDMSGWPYCEMWQPSEFVRNQIEAVYWPTSNKVVGVHVRAALAQPTTPPIDWFMCRMDVLRQEFDPWFFLSTDDPEVERTVKQHFPETFCQQRTYQYDRLGIARAAADLFLLQRCDWMIGSYNSSFSELAGWMRGGAYLPGWGREGWMPGGRYEDSRTPAVNIEGSLG